jgi:membrane-associated phospholipid phosphatase
VRSLTLTKALGTTVAMTVFFVAYFHVLKNPAFDVTVMPQTAFDRAIPFTPQALWVYFSLWVYVALPPALLRTRAELAGYGAWIGALCLAGLLIFWRWPTAVPPRADDVVAHAGFALLHGIDATGNACPSLHVATAAFSAAWLDRLLRELGFGREWRAVNLAWVAAIVWSTVAVRQHVVLDAVGGLLLAVAFAVPALLWYATRQGAVPAYDGVDETSGVMEERVGRVGTEGSR